MTTKPPTKTTTARKKSKATTDSAAAPKDEASVAGAIIKKYPNRRLYDTSTSAYITLADIKKMVVGFKPFIVLDAKTSEDLTRSILLQIILEEESGGVPMFSAESLANIIRFYGHTMQGFMGSYLEKNVQVFSDMQAQLTDQSQHITPEVWAKFMSMQSPMVQGLMGNYAEQSQTLFTQMQEQMNKQTEKMLGVMGLKR